MAYSVRRTPSSRARPVGWNNSFRYSLGPRYDPARQWRLRLGTAYDETPGPSDVLRTPRIPDSDRIWTTFRVAFRWADRVRVDFGCRSYENTGALWVGSRGATRSPSAWRVTASLTPHTLSACLARRANRFDDAFSHSGSMLSCRRGGAGAPDREAGKSWTDLRPRRGADVQDVGPSKARGGGRFPGSCPGTFAPIEPRPT